jgi:hypothetical protein
MKWVPIGAEKPPLNETVFICARSRITGERTIEKAIWSDTNIFDYSIKTEPYWRYPFHHFETNYEITHWAKIKYPPEIGIGDEVCYKENRNSAFFVTKISHDGQYCDGIRGNGEAMNDCTIALLEKTGRHSDTLEKWIRGDSVN